MTGKTTKPVGTPADGRLRQTKLNFVVAEIARLGEVKIPDQDAESLIEYNDTFQAIIDKRSLLSRMQSKLVVAVKSLKARVSGATAEIKIQLDELLVADPEVKSRPSKESRLTLARYKLAARFADLNDLKTRLAEFEGLLSVCEMSDRNLTVAKESLGRIVHVTEMNLVTQGRIPQVQLGRPGLSRA